LFHEPLYYGNDLYRHPQATIAIHEQTARWRALLFHIYGSVVPGASEFDRRRERLQCQSLRKRSCPATDQAVEHAVWDLLHHLGYLQFFPGGKWEVVPREPNLNISVDTFQKPDFHTRRIWYGHGLWDYNEEPYRQWCARNRAVPGFGLSTGHSYGSIVRAHKEVFEKHPQWLALVDGKRQGVKFCISNPELREFVAKEYALRAFRDNPNADRVSLDPSDGGGWCECEACAAMGSISDRPVLRSDFAHALRRTHAGPGSY